MDFTICRNWPSCYGTTCGSAVLAMIVDKNPVILERKFLPKKSVHFSVRTMRRTLDFYGWETHWFKGSQGIVNHGEGASWAADNVRGRHLFLFTADTTRNDASWFICYDGIVYHNSKEFSTSVTFGLTNPAINVLLLRRKNE